MLISFLNNPPSKPRRKLTDAQKVVARAKREVLEDEFLRQCREAELPEPEPQYLFDIQERNKKTGEIKEKRRWRWDFAFFGVRELASQPCKKVAVEIMGSTFTQGRHTRGPGYEEDCRKANRGVDLGWAVYRFTRAMMENRPDGRVRAPGEESEAIYMLRRALGC